MGLAILAIGLILSLAAARLIRRPGCKRIAAAILLLLALPTLTAGAYWTWFTHRSQPAPLHEQWFQGVSYERIVLQSPRALVLHLVRVDLRSPGIQLIFTPVPALADRPLKAATVSTFLRQTHCQVAINANLFYPFYAHSPLSYFPHENDPVQVAGIAAYRGLLYQSGPAGARSDATFFVSQDGRPSFSPPSGAPFNAISGSGFLLRDGKITPIDDTAEPPLYPRTALGLDASANTLFLAVLDGKQPGYSLGATLPEFAALLLHQGAATAINLDGGGSSTLVRQSPAGNPILISSPSNFRLPWWRRPVANHLGIKAAPLP